METERRLEQLKADFQDLIQSLTCIGIELSPASGHDAIIRSNTMAWLMAICGISYAPIYLYVIGSAPAAGLIFICGLAALVVVVLNAAGFGYLARIAQSYVFVGAITIIAYALGAQSGITLLYLPALTVVFLNFDFRETKTLGFVLITTMALAIFMDVEIDQTAATLSLPPAKLVVMRIISRVGATTILMVQLFVFMRTLMKSQERLDTSNQSVISMMESTHDVKYFVDRNWKIVFANKMANLTLCELGLPSENLAGRHFFEMNDMMRKQPFADELIATMKANSNFQGEYRSSIRDRWYEIRAHANEHGMGITYRDITERKQAQDKIAQNEALQTAIFNQAATSLNLITPTGQYVRVNQEMCRLLGYSEAELLEMTFWDILIQNEEHDEGSLSALLDGTVKLYVGERLYRHKDGRSIPVNVQVSVIRNAANVVEFLVVSLQDLSGAKESEQKLVQASKMSSLGEMAGSIAHEINNPMTIISLSAEELEVAALDDVIDHETVMRASARIGETVARVTKIIRGLKAFSRNAEHDPLTLNSVSSLVDETLELCREKFRNKGVELRIGEISKLSLMCRPTEISQVILNLLGNAFDAVEARQGNRWVAIDAYETDYTLRIQITDCGDGIPDSVARRILEPFFTTKEVGKGTGLGLSISKGIVESHGGRLYLDRECQNTRFVMEFDKAFQTIKAESLAG